MPEIPAKYRILDTQALRDDRRTWQSELQLNTLQDEFAGKTLEIKTVSPKAFRADNPIFSQ